VGAHGWNDDVEFGGKLPTQRADAIEKDVARDDVKRTDGFEEVGHDEALSSIHAMGGNPRCNPER
jgi:hypothetical protein